MGIQRLRRTLFVVCLLREPQNRPSFTIEWREAVDATARVVFDIDCDGFDVQRMDWNCAADAAAPLRGVVIAGREFDRARE